MRIVHNAVCPDNPTHKKFFTVVHVAEQWLVDHTGDFLEVVDTSNEVVHGPDVGNTWTCADCGADATVTG